MKRYLLLDTRMNTHVKEIPSFEIIFYTLFLPLNALQEASHL